MFACVRVYSCTILSRIDLARVKKIDVFLSLLFSAILLVMKHARGTHSKECEDSTIVWVILSLKCLIRILLLIVKLYSCFYC